MRRLATWPLTVLHKTGPNLGGSRPGQKLLSLQAEDLSAAKVSEVEELSTHCRKLTMCAYSLDDQISGQFCRNVRRIQYSESHGVLEACQFEIRFQSRNSGIAKIRFVQEATLTEPY